VGDSIHTMSLRDLKQLEKAINKIRARKVLPPFFFLVVIDFLSYIWSFVLLNF
jgi:hypothetical protein